MLRPARLTIAPAALAGLLLAACVSPSPGPAASASDAERRASLEANTDPTAIYLHDLSEGLLLYYAVHGQWPRSLSDIAAGGATEGASGGGGGGDPASGQPFLYTPDAPQLKGLPGRLLVCQSVATGRGGRWALLVGGTGRAGSTVTYVRRLPESMLGTKNQGGH
jgi:hypothetical protein